MKVGYLVSLYPAPSHTFIQREILSLEELGVEVARFSVRKAKPSDLLDQTAKDEAGRTRSLLPLPALPLLASLVWLLGTRPILGLQTLSFAWSNGADRRTKLKWCAYFGEAVLLAYWLHIAKIAHLHCHFGNAGSNTAWLAARLAYVDLSITFHGIDLDEPVDFHHRAKLAESRFAVCISDYGRRRLADNISSHDRSKVKVVRCGYPVPATQSIPSLPNRGEIICVARLSEEKGHYILLEALQQLLHREVQFHCNLVGGGPLRDQLLAQIETLGLENHVSLCGALPNHQVVEMIKNADVSVLASFGEGIPIALLESLAWGRAVVATNVGGIPELVGNNETGILVKPGDADALSQTLQAVIENPETAARFGRAGRARVERMHDPVASAKAMLALFVSAAAAELGTRSK
jgi:colanic acid/amylovoran biosynthesis glycosyltransferase